VQPEGDLVGKDFHFSIVIPSYERRAQLAACLESLTHLDYPRDCFEVIVVDDGSKTPLNDAVGRFRAELNLTLLRQANAGPASARNRGAMEAKGNFLAFTDDDCSPAHDWLRALADRFAAAPEHMIGGRSINALPENLYTTTSQLMTDAVYEYYNHDSGRQHFFASNNLALPTAMFRALGGFDTTFPLPASEDREFCERWLNQGNQMTYAPEAVVHHAHELALRGFFKHYFAYGRGALHFHGVRARAGRERLKVDPKFYRNLFTYPFRHLNRGRALLMEAMLVLAYVAYTGGFLWQKLNYRATVGLQSEIDRSDGPPGPRVSTRLR
jgi:glycosyltransferase involved in cell wall biosynthesis